MLGASSRAEAQLLPHALVPELRQRLGRFDAEAVQVEVILILVVAAQLFRQFASRGRRR